MRVLRGGGGERHRGHRSVIYAGDVGGAVEWRQIKLKTSCDVPATLNQRRTTTFDQRAPTFVPTLVLSPDPNTENDDRRSSLVHSTGVGAPMVLGGRVSHHGQGYRGAEHNNGSQHRLLGRLGLKNFIQKLFMSSIQGVEVLNLLKIVVYFL